MREMAEAAETENLLLTINFSGLLGLFFHLVRAKTEEVIHLASQKRQNSGDIALIRLHRRILITVL